MSRTTVRATDRFLVDAVRSACGRLARGGGWLELLRERHGLDLAADDLAGELSRPLDRIDRSVPGFEDFAAEGVRGIEPGGSPARSLMFHALASPRVRGLDVYPTPAEIEAVENYVYGVRPPSVEDLREQAGGAPPLAIVVYAREYRPADGTAHRRHADMCFSRTGVARIGTSPPVLYGAEARGYLPFVEGDGHAVRVLPCRYAAYIAARVPGHANAHGPMRFIEPGDSERRFWIPLHKLFSGDECLRGHSLTLRLTESHVNEKLRRVHLFFLSHGHDAGWGGSPTSAVLRLSSRAASQSSRTMWTTAPGCWFRSRAPRSWSVRSTTALH